MNIIWTREVWIENLVLLSINLVILSFPGGSDGKESAWNSEEPRSKELELSVCIHISSAFHQSRGINPIFHSEVQRM